MLTHLLKTAVFLGLCVFSPAMGQEKIAPLSKSHTITIDGETIVYTARYDQFQVMAPNGKIGGYVSTTSYIREGGDKKRPVVFAFNGGPGSDSIYLHVGLLGPDRIDLPTDPSKKVPTHARLVKNEDTILDVADIVLIDPVGTGFSRLTDATARSYFYSVGGDARSVADAILSWTEKYQREDAPKYVFGESYGAVRAVGVSQNLVKDGEAKNLKGLILLSQSLPIVDTVQRRSNIVGQVVGLPTMAATAWYHKLAGEGVSLDAFLEEADDFGRSEWLPALFAGNKLPEAKRRAVAEGLEKYTGVSASYVLAHDLYLTKETHRRLAFGSRDIFLGLYDTRYTGPLEGEINPDGVLLTAIANARQKVWKSQFGIDISKEPDIYKIDGLTSVAMHWTYLPEPFAPTSGETYSHIDYVADLMSLMEEHTNLEVIVACGIYDTAASLGADLYLLSRPGLDLTRVEAAAYPAGHMFYTDPASRKDFASLLTRMIAKD